MNKNLVPLDNIKYSPTEDVEVVQCCRAMNLLKLKILILNLRHERDLFQALKRLDDYFKSEKGFTDDNAIINEISGGKYPKKRFINETDETLLYPELFRAVMKETKGGKLSVDEQENINHFLSVYKERWQGRKNKRAKKTTKQLITDNEERYFTKAIKAGLMKQKDNGYEWLHNNGLKASLAYFLKRIFNPKGNKPVPYKMLESLFGVTRLDTALDQAVTTKKPQKWRAEIDILFED